MEKPNISQNWIAYETETGFLKISANFKSNNMQEREIARINIPYNGNNNKEIKQEAIANRQLMQSAPVLMEELIKSYNNLPDVPESEDRKKEIRTALEKAGVKFKYLY